MAFFEASPGFLGADIAHQFLISSPETLQKVASLLSPGPERRTGVVPSSWCSSVSSFSFLMTLKYNLVLIVAAICFQTV